jgi:hypothetical protein
METFRIDRGVIDKIYEELKNFSSKFIPFKMLNLTPYLKNFIKNSKVTLFINFKRQGRVSNGDVLSGGYIPTDKNTRLIYLIIPKELKRVENFSANEKELKGIIRHEIIHALDHINSGSGKIENLPINRSEEYYKSDMEFNAFYHQILDALEENEKEAKKIKTKEDLKKFILKNEIFEPEENFSFMLDRFVKRLKQEKVISDLTENFKNKVKYYLELNNKIRIAK